MAHLRVWLSFQQPTFREFTEIQWLFSCTCSCLVCYIESRVYTPNLPTNIVDFKGFDSSIILIWRGGIPRPIGNSPESLSQAMLVGIMLVGRLGFPSLRNHPGCDQPVCEIRGKISHARKRHLRNHCGFQTHLPMDLQRHFLVDVRFLGGMLQRIVTFPVDVHWNSQWCLPTDFSCSWVLASNLLPWEI